MDVRAGQHKLAVVGHIPCITATRGAASGFFLPHMHRMTEMRELAVQMGLDDKAYDALAHGIPAAEWDTCSAMASRPISFRESFRSSCMWPIWFRVQL